MIEEFTFGNFRSFKEIQTLNLTAANIKSKVKELDQTNIFPIGEDLSLLKSKAIYGANASGKSNVIKALVTFLRIIKNSVKEDQVLSLIDSFQLSTETENEPSFFQLIFRVNDVRYRYGFEADANSIKNEWLFSTPKKREQRLFIREARTIIDINKTHFKEGYLYQKLFKNSDKPIFTESSLFLTHLSSTGFGEVSQQIINAISTISVIEGLGHKGMYGVASESLKDTHTKKFILDFLKNADTGINELNAVEIRNENLPDNIEDELRDKFLNKKIIISSRTKYNAKLKSEGSSDFSFSMHESEGTKRMFELSPFIYSSLKEGTTLFVDEFDSRFHPLLTQKIVGLYNSIENEKAQLIFITHDTNLLSSDLLRRDQIDFVEKDKYGASHLYSLVEIKGVRNDASFKKDYIQGRYGAIPFLGSF